MNKQALIEVAKSFGRFIWFGFLATLTVALTAVASEGAILEAEITVLGQTMALGPVLVAIIGLAVKAIDRYIHANKDSGLKGIAPNFLQK